MDRYKITEVYKNGEYMGTDHIITPDGEWCRYGDVRALESALEEALEIINTKCEQCRITYQYMPDPKTTIGGVRVYRLTRT
jgi:hypothetical protein